MATIDLRSFEARQRFGLRSGNVSERSQREKREQYHRGRAESQALIYSACVSAEYLTRLEIARAVGRAKTPHLVALIEELVEHGILVRHELDNGNGLPIFVYKPR